MTLIKINAPLGRIHPPPILLDCPDALLLKQRALVEQFDSILSL